jgi:hypothetical protein
MHPASGRTAGSVEDVFHENIITLQADQRARCMPTGEVGGGSAALNR